MFHHKFSYGNCLRSSNRINWQIDAEAASTARLDFAKPFLPEALVRSEKLEMLTQSEKLVLNQIRGYGYLLTFAMIEQFTLRFVMDQLGDLGADDNEATRALLGFAIEEANHVRLFDGLCGGFRRNFGSHCETLGDAGEIGKVILDHHPLAVALLILQMEWMTQAHFLESVRDPRALEPMFEDVLEHHWQEETEHAKLDTLMIDTLLRRCDEDDVQEGIADYFALVDFLDDHLMSQVERDCDSLQAACGRTFGPDERRTIVVNQRQAMRYTFFGAGLQHPSFLAVIKGISPDTRRRVEEMTRFYC